MDCEKSPPDIVAALASPAVVVAKDEAQQDPCLDHFPLAEGLVEPVDASDAHLTTDDPTTYPEGGFAAWLVVAGSFFGIFVAFGLLNSVGVFQAYLSTHQLASHSVSSVGWIFSVYIALGLFCCLQVGPIFDAKGPRVVVAAGCTAAAVGLFLFSISKEFYQFLLVFGLVVGPATAFIFAPCIGAIGHFFLVKRGMATGIAISGGSIGGIIIPLMMRPLFTQVGFGWSIRILTFIFVAISILCIVLVRARLPPKPGTSMMPDLRFLRNVDLALTVVGVFCMEWALFIPLNYLTLFALSGGNDHGHISETLAYQLNSIINAGSFLGRLIPGYISDTLGRFNTALGALALCVLSNIALWLPATLLEKDSRTSASTAIKPLVLLFAVVFGFASGSNISLTPVCIGQLCETEQLGRYLASCYTIVSVAALTGIPMAGAVLTASGGSFWGMAVLTGSLYLVAFGAFAAVRVRKVGWSPTSIF